MRPFQAHRGWSRRAKGLAALRKNPIVSKLLISRGWVESIKHDDKAPDASLFHELDLLWRVTGSGIEFKHLPPGALCNHFEKPSPLTTKIGFA